MIHKSLLTSTIQWALLASVPAAPCGCSGEMLQKTHVSSDSETETELHFSETCMTSQGSTLDILTFEDDRMARLDSYRRIENFDWTYAHASSTGGDKIFFICADGQRDKYGWADVCSYHSLGKISFDLENESLERHTKTGECRLTAGSRNGIIDLKPLVSEVILKSISCDFSGTQYEDRTISNVKVYLTNVNATYPIQDNTNSSSMRFINIGMLNMYELGKFKNPEILMQNIAGQIDKKIIYPQTRLLCYPNLYLEDNPGSPETRLVIEGKIDSDTYYWPITINKGKGVERNCIYSYEILIKRKGVTDPDIPIDPKEVEFIMKVKSWKETEEYGIRF